MGPREFSCWPSPVKRSTNLPRFVNSRYEIQDILAQDASGVVFRAHDRESDCDVVLRRFFPFGVDGGGLEEEERIAYDIAVRRLMEVEHPALRRVLNGGTDPVDGMPFIVTEWHEGDPLSERLKIRPLSPPSAKALADMALECSQILSDTFQEETIWIETHPLSIILGGAESDRKVTFWISPLRWLGSADERSGLRPIVDMIEEVTGWKDSVVPDSAGDGLGWWFKALRKNPDQWSLEQARNALHEGPPSAKPTPTVQGVRPAAMPSGPQTIPAGGQLLPPKNSTTIWPWIIAGVLTTSALAFVGWQATRERQVPPPISVGMDKDEATEPTKKLSPAEAASARALALAEEAQSADAPVSPTVGEPFTVEGPIKVVRQSRSKKTTYLIFEGAPRDGIIGIRHRTSIKAVKLPWLKKFAGAEIRVTGKVVKESGGLLIELNRPEQIERLEE